MTHPLSLRHSPFDISIPLIASIVFYQNPNKLRLHFITLPIVRPIFHRHSMYSFFHHYTLSTTLSHARSPISLLDIHTIKISGNAIKSLIRSLLSICIKKRASSLDVYFSHLSVTSYHELCMYCAIETILRPQLRLCIPLYNFPSSSFRARH